MKLENSNVYIVREPMGFNKEDKLYIYYTLEQAEKQLYHRILREILTTNILPTAAFPKFNDYYILNQQIYSNGENPIPYLVIMEYESESEVKVTIKRGWKFDFNMQTRAKYIYPTLLATDNEVDTVFILPIKIL